MKFVLVTRPDEADGPEAAGPGAVNWPSKKMLSSSEVPEDLNKSNVACEDWIGTARKKVWLPDFLKELKAVQSLYYLTIEMKCSFQISFISHLTLRALHRRHR